MTTVSLFGAAQREATRYLQAASAQHESGLRLAWKQVGHHRGWLLCSPSCSKRKCLDLHAASVPGTSDARGLCWLRERRP